MRRSEKGWFVAGILLGVAIAGTLYAFRDTVEAVYDRLGAPRSASAPARSLTQSAPLHTAQPEPVDTTSSSSVQLTTDEQRSIGVETVEVKRQAIRKEITVPGKIAEPETGIGTISARIGGRIDKLLVNVTGASISRGQAVALIYSPEVFTAGEEYRLSLENRQRLSASREPQAISDADELVRASRRRLELRGLTPQQIDEIATSADRPVEITIYSPVAGVITKRNLAEGQYIKEGDVLFEVTDLGTVWVQADIFESDISSIRIGQPVKISAPTTGTIQGTIAFLQPSVDPQTRTMTARIQVANPQMRLRPGMFVQVSAEVSLGANVVAVPRSAVLETGKEKVVYVAKEAGVFEKRPVEATMSGGDYYAVTKGVEPGERVVTNGNFLIDSQTRLSGNITGMFGGSKAFETETSKYTVNLRSEPSVLKAGSDGMFHVTVTDPDGKPVTDAQVQVGLLMPAMPSMGMGEMRSSVNLSWNGSEYTGSGTIAMAGPWNVTVEARRGGQLLGVYRTRFDAK